MSGSRRLDLDDSGSSAVEFALLTPVLVSGLLGLLAIGWALSNTANLGSALDYAGRQLQLDPELTVEELRSALRERFYLDDAGLSLNLQTTVSADGYALQQLDATYTAEINILLVGEFPFSFSRRLIVPVLAP